MANLNQGMGAGDSDVRLPPQKLRIVLPRYNNPIQILDNGYHVNSFLKPSGVGTFKGRKPLTTVGGFMHTLRGIFKR